MNYKNLLNIYYGLFHSLATYGIISWGGAYQNIMGRIKAVQERIVAIVSRGVSKKQRDVLCPMTLNQVYKLEVLMYKYYDLRSSYVNSQSRSRGKILPLPAVKLNSGKRKTDYLAIVLFNQLPVQLKNVRHLNSYGIKKRLKDWIKKMNEEKCN